MLHFNNRIVFVGFGFVARCTLPILLDHIKVKPSAIRIIEFQPDEASLKPWIAKGVNFEG
jgi:homospermidine synthase